MIRWILIALAALAALTAALYGVGAATPRRHVAEVQGLVAQPTAQVAAKIRAVSAYPTWRAGVTVRDIAAEDGALTYVEVADGDAIAYRLTEPAPDAQFVTTITDQTLPFGGAWTISLTPDAAATRVRIREDGDVRDPLYRFFARYVFGHTSSMETYLKSLGATEVRTVSTS